MQRSPDTPGVIAPPPLIAFAALLLGLALDWVLPSSVVRHIFGLVTRLVFGGMLIAAGMVLAVAAVQRFRRAGTNVEPWKPAVSLVTDGIYALTRNPMYFALILMLAGIGIALGSDWIIVLSIPAALLLHFGVIKREERYLEQKFGESYRAYMRKVPRYWV